MEQNIEVINLDGNDSRSPSPERDRYKRRKSRSTSRGRDRRGGSRDRRRRSRSRSTERSRSPRSNRRRNSKDRERSSRDVRDNRDNREKERDREHERERRKKGLPELKKEHLSVCSTTLWVGHLSKLVYQEELSDTFGEFGDIVSIDQIVPRGCAFIVMHRRQDAYKAMNNLKNHKLQGRAITISWAAGKGVKSKEWKDYWDLDLGVTYIPWNKIDENTNFDSMEEGGMFDEDSMPTWMKEKIQRTKNQIDKLSENNNQPSNVGGEGTLLFGIDTTQPPPPAAPSLMSMTLPGQFSMAPPRPMLGPMGMPIQGLSMPPNIMPGMPPPHAMIMPPGMMPPGFPMPQSGLPSLNASTIGMPPPNPPQFAAPTTTTSASYNSSDDQMDIVMDEDENTGAVPTIGATAVQSQLNFNQPPPLFNNPNSLNALGSGQTPESNGAGEIFSRDRNRSSSRWSGFNRSGDGDSDANNRWRESMPGNLNENCRNGGGHSQRPDFMNENRSRFEVGAGPRGPDFFPNMQQNTSRFNHPTSLLQMRIAPPPNMFNPRMGGPKGGGAMFMRGGAPGGGGAGRQQAPGGFFNSRNPFNDGGRGGGRSMRATDGRNNRGGRNSYGSNNWSDEESDDVIKWRGGSNRYREEPRGEDRSHRGSKQAAGDWTHQRNDRKEYSRNHRSSRNQEDEKQKEGNSPKAQNNACDTEDDWDRELEEYDARMANAENINSTESDLLKDNDCNQSISDQNTFDVIEETPILDELTNSNSFCPPETNTNKTPPDSMDTEHAQPADEEQIVYTKQEEIVNEPEVVSVSVSAQEDGSEKTDEVAEE